MKYKYRIELVWSEEDQVFLAIVPELKGCSSFGDTPEEALSEVEKAIGLWLEVAEEKGIDYPAPLPSVQELATAAPLLNKAALARRMGMEERTLTNKLKRGVSLSQDEAKAAYTALRSVGLGLVLD